VKRKAEDEDEDEDENENEDPGPDKSGGLSPKLCPYYLLPTTYYLLFRAVGRHVGNP
jgi:hypothetical protein